ncbi:hypothetical protein SAMN04487902_1165 [Prevotella sp. ne3005]|nr:hypothetical protein SAMN04487902_1165 [Prevotella sp. ne3005]
MFYMKQLFLFTLLLVAIGENSFATNTKDKLYTLDNKMYTGYISTQIPGEQIIFISDGQAIPFSISDLLMIRYEANNPELLTGLNDVIRTRSGNIYQGQIVEQVFGKTIKIETSDGLRNIDISDILEQQKVRMSKDYSYMEQAPYKNIVKTQTGDEYVGVIISQYYGRDEAPSYLEIRSEDGISKRIYIRDIEQIRRIPNETYREVEAFSVKDGKVYFNQVEIEPVCLAIKKKGKRIISYLENKDIANHTVIDSRTGQLSIQMKEDSDYSRYKLIKIKLMKIGKKEYYAYDNDLVSRNNIEPYTSTRDKKKILTKVYNVRKGMYLFYRQGSNSAFFMEIK